MKKFICFLFLMPTLILALSETDELIKYTFFTDTWSSSVKVKFELIGDYLSYTIDESEPVSLNAKNEFVYEFTQNGSYLLKFMTLTETFSKKINISLVDNTPPIIKKLEVKKEGKTATITIEAFDEASGLDSLAFAFGDKTAWVSKNEEIIYQSGQYNFYVRDKVGNIYEGKVDILLDSVPIELNNIIYGDVSSGKRKVIFTFFNYRQAEVALVNDRTLNDEKNWQQLTNPYTIYLAPGTYTLWLNDGSYHKLKTFSVGIEKEFNLKLVIVPIILLIIGGVGSYYWLNRHRNGKI